VKKKVQEGRAPLSIQTGEEAQVTTSPTKGVKRKTKVSKVPNTNQVTILLARRKERDKRGGDQEGNISVKDYCDLLHGKERT